ncbi:MAG: LysR family transcriptional regulator [Asticcacaulis sp.]|nr:LysR family transcriptional regulator [Asticcacaulis sp.]
MVDTINLNRLSYFSAVVDAGSFTKAADRLGVTKTVVSQQVARLEAEVGTSLLVRSTRRVEPTEAGRRLHARCVMIFREADDAFRELAQANAEPRGTLRVTATNDYGTSVVAHVAAAFCTRYPLCGVELLLSDTKFDLIQSQIDLSVRVGWLDDSTLLARKIGTFDQITVAAPELSRELGDAAPDDLAMLPFIANTALREPLSWHYARGDVERRTVHFQARLSMNATPAVLTATLAGGGFAVLPDFLVADDLKAGRLVRLLPEWSLPPGGIHAVFPAGRFRQPKVTAFVAMLAEEVKRLGVRSQTS